MSSRNEQKDDSATQLSFWLLVGFLAVLWLGGGASRADAAGQALTRFTAWGILVAYILFSKQLAWRRFLAVSFLLGAAIVLTAIQLMPLPPELWTTLPGRDLLTEAATVLGQPQPWRPISISPAGTANSLASLIVPAVVLLLASNLGRIQHRRIVTLLLLMMIGGCLLAVMQLSGSRIDNPLINEVPDSVSGNFANRNHFALFLASGFVLAPLWAFDGSRRQAIKAGVCFAIMLIFALILLATGSRSGLVVGTVALGAGVLIAHRPAIAEFRRLPRKLAIAGATVLALVAAVIVALTIKLGRAASIDRTIALDTAEDLRTKATPAVIDAIAVYFPVGAGIGTFDPVYRISEPDSLLMRAYLNHAHNDWLEVLLEGGILGGILLLAAVAWWLTASIRAWHSARNGHFLSFAGSTIILLVMIASATDYPARTPLVMAMIVLCAVWLTGHEKVPAAGRSKSISAPPQRFPTAALPGANHDL